MYTIVWKFITGQKTLILAAFILFYMFHNFSSFLFVLLSIPRYSSFRLFYFIVILINMFSSFYRHISMWIFFSFTKRDKPKYLSLSTIVTSISSHPFILFLTFFFTFLLVQTSKLSLSLLIVNKAFPLILLTFVLL